MTELQRLAGHSLGAIDGGLDLETETGLNDPVELLSLVAYERIRGQSRQTAANHQQRRQAVSGILGVEARDRILRHSPDDGAARNAVPRRVDTIEEVLRCRL